MALLASHGRMLFNQRVSGLTVIELLEGWLPMNERKIRAIMFEVASHAVPAIGIFHSELGMEALVYRKTLGNFLVAFQALERRRTGAKLVA